LNFLTPELAFKEGEEYSKDGTNLPNPENEHPFDEICLI